ncbi:MAG TPA: glycosyltransferase family 4 protein, partial [Methanomicrobiales archaeon]|nr:glycosyltransferase family 4 protein [Methanomicrobiales archaeon]
MRIAFLYDCVYPWTIGGVERRVHELGRRLASRGHEVHHFGMKFWDGPATIESGGVRIHGVTPASPLYEGGRRAILPAARYAASLLPPLLDGEFDIIDAQQFPYLHCFPASLAAFLGEVPLVITWHEVWGDYWREYLGELEGLVGEATEWAVARLPATAAAVSRTTRDQLAGLGTARPIEILPNGIDTRAIASAPPAAGHWDLLYAGRLIPEKRVDLLVSAIPFLLGDFPSLRVLIVGDGPERDALIRQAGRLGVADRVTFAGFLPDASAVTGCMKSASVFVSPSVREGFGMGALEAMACGTPVVTVDHPRNAVVERITTSTGRVAALTPEDLAAKIGECLADPSGFGEACMAMAAGYDWDLIAPRAE